MSLTKRIWIEGDPKYEDVRRQHAEQVWKHNSEFKHRASTKRRNKRAKKPYWDPLWPIAINRAVRELAIETVRINGGVFFRSADELASALALAESKWRELAERMRSAGNVSL